MGRHEVEELPNLAPCRFVGPLFGLSHEMLELGEELLDGVEVWAIRRQEEKMCALAADSLARGPAFVRAEIVEDDDVALFEGRDEYLFDVGGEQDPVDRSVDDTGRIDPVMPQGGDKGQGLPMAIGNRGGETLPSGSPTAQRRHIGLDPGLVKKDQTAGRDTRLMIFPATPLASDVRTFLLGGQNRFF